MSHHTATTTVADHARTAHVIGSHALPVQHVNKGLLSQFESLLHRYGQFLAGVLGALVLFFFITYKRREEEMVTTK